MKQKMFLILFVTVAGGILASCSHKQEAENQPQEVPVVEQYVPVRDSIVIDLAEVSRYNYVNAPKSIPAESVQVVYDNKRPYASPVEVRYSYDNGDTYTYIIPAEFGLWTNERGFFRVVTDSLNTVWLQGQTKRGKLVEFVFFGTPELNGTKIKPNSYKTSPNGTILYRKVTPKPLKTEEQHMA